MTKGKESEEKKVLEEPRKKDSKNQEIMWILIVMGVLLGSVLFTYLFVQSLKHFDYQGLSFSSEKFGKLDVYHYSYYFNDSTGQIFQYNLYLRGDPRTNDIPVAGNKIAFKDGKYLYVSVNTTGLTKCDNASIAIAGLTSFLSDNQLTVRGATPDKNEAGNRSIKFASCAADASAQVIEISAGDKTEIFTNKSCYKITVANCDILQATEKFEVQSIIDAKSAR